MAYIARVSNQNVENGDYSKLLSYCIRNNIGVFEQSFNLQIETIEELRSNFKAKIIYFRFFQRYADSSQLGIFLTRVETTRLKTDKILFELPDDLKIWSKNCFTF